MSGSGTSGNQVLGNRIGTNPEGTAATPNGLVGVIVTGGAHDQVIGTATAGNLISGKTSAGLWLTGAGVSNNTVRGNWFVIDGSGVATIDLVLPAFVPVGRVITARARGASGTSGFSNGVTVTTTDSDGDGMPDAYERTIPGLSSADAADAAADLTGPWLSEAIHLLGTGGILVVIPASGPRRFFRVTAAP